MSELHQLEEEVVGKEEKEGWVVEEGLGVEEGLEVEGVVGVEVEEERSFRNLRSSPVQ